VELEPGFVSLNGGQDLEFYDDLCAGQAYTATAKLAEVYEKTGRSDNIQQLDRFRKLPGRVQSHKYAAKSRLLHGTALEWLALAPERFT